MSVHMSMYISAHMSMHMSAHMSMYISAHMSMHMSAHMSMHMSAHMSMHISCTHPCGRSMADSFYKISDDLDSTKETLQLKKDAIERQVILQMLTPNPR